MFHLVTDVYSRESSEYTRPICELSIDDGSYSVGCYRSYDLDTYLICERLSCTPISSCFTDDITIVEDIFAIESIGDMSRELQIGECSDSRIRFLAKL